MNNIILTTSFGYSSDQLKCFLVSAHQNIPSAEIAIFTDNSSSAFQESITSFHPHAHLISPLDLDLRQKALLSMPLLRRLGRLPPTRVLCKALWGPTPAKDFSTLSMSKLHVMVARYIWMAHWIENNDVDHDRILLTDARDVLFQGDPFIGSEASLTCGVEEVRIGDCPTNSAWIKQVYADDDLSQLNESLVLCSGVSLGGQAQILEYLEAMIRDMSTYYGRLIGRGALDQAIHNKILHADKAVPLVVCKNGEELLATLHLPDLSPFDFDESNGLRTKQGKHIKIAHQYDRHPHLKSWAEKTFGMSS